MPRSQAIARQAGGLILLGFDGTKLSAPTRKLLRELQPAGVILFARNMVSPRQVYFLLRDCTHQVEAPLWRAVDLEGGSVDRLQHVIAAAPAPAAVTATADCRAFRAHGRLIGDECRALGFNLDFAPACDLALPQSSAALGMRAASPDPAIVTRYAREFLAGLGEAGVLGCLKHFPGLGGAALDTHHAQPRVTRSWNAMWKADLVPFRSLRWAAPFVMVGHASYPSADKNKAATSASLSHHWITGVLRGRIGFRGLVITDDLEMKGVGAAAPEAAVAAIAAGADLALICHREECIRGAREAMIREAEREPAFRRRLAEASARVARFKARRPGLLKFPAAPSAANIVHLRQQLRRFNEAISSNEPIRQ